MVGPPSYELLGLKHPNNVQFGLNLANKRANRVAQSPPLQEKPVFCVLGGLGYCHVEIESLV